MALTARDQNCISMVHVTSPEGLLNYDFPAHYVTKLSYNFREIIHEKTKTKVTPNKLFNQMLKCDFFTFLQSSQWSAWFLVDENVPSEQFRHSFGSGSAFPSRSDHKYSPGSQLISSGFDWPTMPKPNTNNTITPQESIACGRHLQQKLLRCSTTKTVQVQWNYTLFRIFSKTLTNLCVYAIIVSF